MKKNYDVLKLENQLCFPLYAASKEVVKSYTPFLSELDLTYTQYIVMLALWEYEKLSVKALGDKLFLDSGTLTPVIKSLQEKGYVEKARLKEDERVIEVTLTTDGEEPKKKAIDVPEKISREICLSPEEAMTLYGLLYKILKK